MQFHIDEAVEVLAQTPGVMDALLRGKSAAWLNSRKTTESFSPVDVLGHLIHGEKTDWIPRVQLILDYQDARTFEPFDRFGFQSWISGMSAEDLLDEFAELRRQSLQTLRSLGINELKLDCCGTHPEFGLVTLRNLIATWAVHDLGHIAQVVKTMAYEYCDAVGPWRAYTSILD